MACQPFGKVLGRCARCGRRLGLVFDQQDSLEGGRNQGRHPQRIVSSRQAEQPTIDQLAGTRRRWQGLQHRLERRVQAGEAKQHECPAAGEGDCAQCGLGE